MNFRYTKAEKAAWVAWLKVYSAEKFFEAFMENAQGARSTCLHCGEPIYLDIVEGGGVCDWRTEEGDYGCNDSPETTTEGCGSHKPQGLTVREVKS
jgi:hypothetical protein